MIHYISKPTHVKCLSANGKRLSPVRSLSYDSGLVLQDRDTGNSIYRPHKITDGTQILYTDIFHYQKSKYTDTSIPVEERLSNLANDLYASNRQKGERILANFKFALPIYFDDEQLKELTSIIGKEFSQTFKRPIVISIHKKIKNGRKNFHAHMSTPERELGANDKWKSKRSKIYKDWNGKLLYDKQYKNENGHDIRKPLIDQEKVPVGHDPYEKDTNGQYLFQKRDEKGRRKWECYTGNGKWLESKDLIAMHNQWDDIVNRYFKEHGIDDKVVRHDPEVKNFLKEAGVPYIKYGIHATEEEIAKASKTNARYRACAKVLEESKTEQERQRMEAEQMLKQQKEVTRKIHDLEDKRYYIGQEIKHMEKSSPLPAYVEKVIYPEERFVEMMAKPYCQFLSKKEEITNTAINILDSGIASIKTETEQIKSGGQISPSAKARVRFLKTNATMMHTLQDNIHSYARTNQNERIQEDARKRWRYMTKWAKYRFIKSRCKEVDAYIYKSYLGLGNEEKGEGHTIPSPVPINKEAMGQIAKISEAVFREWNNTISSDNHIPPQNLKFLSELVSMESALSGTPAEKIYNPPTAYDALQGQREYTRSIKEIERMEEEAERKKEAERLEKERLEKERLARIEAERREKERLAKLEQERLAEQKRIQEAEAERKRIAEQKRISEEKRLAEERRIAEEKRLAQLAAERKAEEKRIAEQKRIEAERLAEEKRKEEEHSLTSSAQDSAAPSDGGMAPRVTKADYYVLSDKLVIEKLHIMISLARMTVADGSRQFTSITDGIEYYDRHSKVFESDMERYGTDSEKYKSIKGEMQRIWPIVKDEKFDRPMMLTQKPNDLIAPEQLVSTEKRLIDLMQKAQTEKSPLIKKLVDKSIMHYIEYENRNRQRYNTEHCADKNFVRKSYIQYTEAMKELEQMYSERTDIFIEAAKQYNMNITPYTAPAEKAEILKLALDESYIYYNIKDKNSMLAKKKRKTAVRTKTMDKDWQTEK